MGEDGDPEARALGRQLRQGGPPITLIPCQADEPASLQPTEQMARRLHAGAHAPGDGPDPMAIVRLPHDDDGPPLREGQVASIGRVATGTHTGDWDLLGVKLPATGKSVELNMVFIWRIADGRIAEGWELDDNMPFLQALGVVDYTVFGKPLEEVFR